MITNKVRAQRNRTINLSEEDIIRYEKNLLEIKKSADLNEILNKTIHGDIFKIIGYLPKKFVDLAFVDPPYNLNKTFNLTTFKEMESDKYAEWLDSWISKIIPLLKKDASVYICGDWKSSGAIFNVAKKYFHIQNRITWERDKGRGAEKNWKNCSEDIWFCTLSKNYIFNIENVKMKRKVLAPYKDRNGKPKDWEENGNGKYRETHPSNFWTDITVPFWSMPENTDHPTQKPEKLVAKIILASSNKGDVIFDPFLGSGTTSVVAKKLDRKYVGIEIDKQYCLITEKRLDMVNDNRVIQGYSGGIFWERNTLNEQLNGKNGKYIVHANQESLFVS